MQPVAQRQVLVQPEAQRQALRAGPWGLALVQLRAFQVLVQPVLQRQVRQVQASRQIRQGP